MYYSIWLLVGLFALGSCHRISLEEELLKHRPRGDYSPPPPSSLKVPLTGIFVDINSSALLPDGKSWDTAFKTIQAAVAHCALSTCKGKDIIIAAGTYKEFIILDNVTHLRFIGGYKSGELYERVRDFKDDEWVILDDYGAFGQALVSISGSSSHISFAGGFIWQNAPDESAISIQGDKANYIKDIVIQHSKFNNNIKNRINESGGAIYAQYVKGLSLENIDAKHNKADHGGAFAFKDVENLTILGGIWENNEASITSPNGEGGAMHLENITNLKMINTIFRANSAEIGSALYIRDIKNESIGPIRIENHSNSKSVKDLGIFIDDCDHLALKSVSLVDNQAPLGRNINGIINIDNSQYITLDSNDAEVKNNHTTYGGVLYITNSEHINISHGLWQHNQADYGGAIFANSTSNINIKHMTFKNHEATNNGGVINLAYPGDAITITASHFMENKAKHGGAIFMANALAGHLPTINIDDSSFIGNKASGNGGAILTSVTKSSMIINALFTHNQARLGGALALDGYEQAARFIIGKESKFINNEALRGAGGGAIYVRFRDSNAVPIGTAQPQRQLIFYMAHADQYNNISGEIKSPAVIPGSAGKYGNFLRVASHDTQDIAGDDHNTAPRVFPALLNRFIAYDDGGNLASPWNQLGLNWGADIDVYAW